MAFKEQQYTLIDFNKVMNNELYYSRESITPKLYLQRAMRVAVAILGLIGAGVGIWLLWRLPYFTRRLVHLGQYYADTARCWAISLLNSGLEKWCCWRIREIALEESVRHTTRSSLSEATDSEHTALRARISDALEQGDTEMAKTLMGVLQKLEDNKK